MRPSGRLLSLCATYMLLVLPASVEAQGRLPELAGHTFVPTAIIRDPFLDTRLETVVGLGEAFDFDITGPGLIGDTVLRAEGTMTWVVAGFDYLHTVNDWLALGGEITGGARVGTNAAAAIADGVSIVTGIRLGGMARLKRSESVMLSLNVDLMNSDLTLLNVQEFTKSVIDSVQAGGRIDSVSLSSGAHALQGRAGLRLAYAPARVLGITAVAEVGIGDNFIEFEETNIDFDLGATLDLNLASVGKAPIGFTAGYRFGTFSRRAELSSGDTHVASLGISYVGQDDFTVGLEAFGQWLPLGDGERLKAVIYMVRTRYYF